MSVINIISRRLHMSNAALYYTVLSSAKDAKPTPRSLEKQDPNLSFSVPSVKWDVGYALGTSMSKSLSTRVTWSKRLDADGRGS
jgi:hypothetical protein